MFIMWKPELLWKMWIKSKSLTSFDKDQIDIIEYRDI